MSSVVVAFYEDIPNFPPARQDMPRWWRYSEVAQNRQVFSHMIGDKEYDKLLQYMAKNQHRYRPRPPE